MTPYDRMVAALDARGSRRMGNNWQCPAHDDRTPSLSVNASTTDAGEPTVVFYCHAGCVPAAILPPLGLEPSDLFPNEGRGVQGELFPKSRYSPVGLDILLKLRPGAERSFVVASAFGRYVTPHGTRAHVYSQRSIAAVILERKHRRAVEETLGIASNQLRNDIVRWESWAVAHKCDREILTILIRTVDACPVCRTPLVDGVWSPKAPLADGVPGYTAPVLESAIGEWRSGFFKGLDGGAEIAGSEPDVAAGSGPTRRSRAFEPDPEILALEAEQRRRDPERWKEADPGW